MPPEGKPPEPIPLLRGLHHTFRSLRHRNYRLYFSGQLISLLGSWMQTTALMWLAYRLTDQSLWPALIAAAQVLPTFLFGAWGGLLADRWPKRPLIRLTQAAFLALALVLAGMVVAGLATPWPLLALTAAGGVVNAIDLPARLAFVVDLVDREDVMNAVALNSVLFNLARVLGPPLAMLVLLRLGPETCFLANALSYVPVLLALGWISVDGRSATAAGRGLGELAGGFGYLADRTDLALLLAVAGLMALVGWPSLALLPAVADKGLGEGAQAYGTLLSGVGVGALVAALVLARFGSPQHSQGQLTAGIGAAGMGLAGLSWAPDLWSAAGCCALLGFGLILFFATGQAVFQLGAGDHNRGRLMGIWSMVLSGTQPMGNLLAGPAADTWSEAAVLRAQAAGCAVAVLLLVLPPSKRGTEA